MTKRLQALEELSQFQKAILAGMCFLAATWPAYLVRSTSVLSKEDRLGLALAATVMVTLGFFFVWSRTIQKKAEAKQSDISFLIYTVSGLLAVILLQQILEGYFASYLDGAVTILAGVIIALAVEGRSPKSVS